MKIKKQIGWQKYEDVIQNQLESPILENMLGKMLQQPEEYDDEELAEMLENEGISQEIQPNFMVPVDEKLMENITLMTNFDCWMGHTNFNLTESIRDKLNEMEGVEVLKICSRYRFFVGIGRMFDFKEVRKDIENTFTGETNEQKD